MARTIERSRVVGQIHHETAVDLDFVERDPAKIGEARIACSEIVEREANAEICERLKDALRRWRGLEKGQFRRFEFEPMWRQAMAFQRFGDNRGNVRMTELDWRDVDGDRNANSHEAAIRHASSMIHWPSTAIEPFSSAIGMNSIGGISPRTGCVQRGGGRIRRSLTSRR